jgi:hypothetical protein
VLPATPGKALKCRRRTWLAVDQPCPPVGKRSRKAEIEGTCSTANLPYLMAMGCAGGSFPAAMVNWRPGR